MKNDHILDFIDANGMLPLITFRSTGDVYGLHLVPEHIADLYIHISKEINETNPMLSQSLIGAMYHDRSQTEMTMYYDDDLLDFLDGKSDIDGELLETDFDDGRFLYTVCAMRIELLERKVKKKPHLQVVQ